MAHAASSGPTTGFDRRITRLETWAESFEEKFDANASAVREQFRVLEGQLSHGLRAIDTKLGDIERARRPNWQVWIGAAGLFLTMSGLMVGLLGSVGGMALVPLYQQTRANQRTILSLRSEIKEHIDAGGLAHPYGTSAKVDALTRAQDDIQNEMRALKDVIAAHTASLARLTGP